MWLICPKCLDAFEGIPGSKCLVCSEKTVVTPLFNDYAEIWEEWLEEWDEELIEEIGSHKNMNYGGTVMEFCDGDLHFAADRHDDLLYAYECNC
jgi:hypothetical protein